MNYRKVWTALAVTSVLTLNASARSPDLDEDELARALDSRSYVTIATGIAQALRTAPSVATVITADDIEAMGATDLDDVLESVPGLHVSRSPIGYYPLYVVRGVVSAVTPQVLVLQNGIPITELFQGTKGDIWGGYPVNHIARIEVIRGPGSAIYGSDAYSGVINIITKSASDIDSSEAGFRVGSFGTKDGWAQHRTKMGGASIATYLRAGTTDGFTGVIDADAQSENDRIFGTSASLAPGSINTGRRALDGNFDMLYGKFRFIAGYKLRDRLRSGAGVAQALDPVGRMKSVRFTTESRFTAPHFSEDVGVEISLASLYYSQQTPTDVQLLPPGAALPTGSFPTGLVGGPDTWQQQYRLSGYITYSGIQQHKFRLGIGHDDLDLYRTSEYRNFDYTPSGIPTPLPHIIEVPDTSIFLRPARRKIDYFYAQDVWDFSKNWTMTTGLRYDNYSDFGDTINPRYALVWEATPTITAKFLYGRAFRAPAFVESQGQANPVLQANPLINPETINTIDASVQWLPRSGLYIVATAYRFNRASIIEPVPNVGPHPGSTYQNSGRQTGRGLELETKYTVSKKLSFVGNVSFQKTINDVDQSDAGFAPTSHFNARFEYRPDTKSILTPQLNCVSGRKREAGDARAPLNDYCVVDFAVNHKFNDQEWTAALSFRNLFDADAREPNIGNPRTIPNDLPMARRSVSLEVSRQFN